MTKRGTAKVVTALPGFAAIQAAIRDCARKKGATITSPSAAMMACIRDFAENDEELSISYGAGALDLKPLSELVSMFIGAALMPRQSIANSDLQTAIAGVAASRLPLDSAFYDARRFPGFHEALCHTMQELRHHRIDLSSAESLPKKLADIKYAANQFDAELARNSVSTLSHRIEALLEEKPARPESVKSLLWVGENEWPPLWLDFAEWILSAGVNITFFCERHTSNNEFFECKPAQKFGVSPTPVESAPPLGAFLFSDKKVEGASSSITIMEAADEFLETEWAVRIAAAKPKSCLFVRSLDTYGPLLQAAALRLGVSLEMSRRERLLSNPFAQHCLSALKACCEKRTSSVAELVFSGYSEVSHLYREQAADEIRACVRYDDPWAELAKRAKDEDSPVPQWFAGLCTWRNSAINAPGTLLDWMHRLNRLIANMPWLRASNDVEGRRDTGAQDAMVRSLSVSKILSEPRRLYTFEEFVSHCERIWNECDYAVRTDGPIRVTPNVHAIGERENVIAIGVLEGHFPRRRAEDPILLDADRDALLKMNKSWRLPSSYERAEEDRRDFYRLLCSAPNITLCYPAAVSENPEVPAAYLADVQGLGESVQFIRKSNRERFPKVVDALADIDALAGARWHKESTPHRLKPESASLEAAVANSQMHDISDQALADEISQLPRSLRMSHIKALAECPFRYVAMAKLGLRGKRPKWAWERLGNVVRRAKISSKTMEELRDSLMIALSEELESLKGKVPQEEIDLIAISAPKALTAFAEREMAARKEWNIEPLFVNATLQEAGMRTSLPLQGKRIDFEERIDIVYKRKDGEDLMPLKLGSVPDEGGFAREFQFEAGILLLLQQDSIAERHAAIDSLQTGARRVMTRRKDSRASNLNTAIKKHLYVDRAPENANHIRQEVQNRLAEILAAAAMGDISARPGEHCQRCDYACLCRRSQFAEFAQSRFDDLEEDEA